MYQKYKYILDFQQEYHYLFGTLNICNCRNVRHLYPVKLEKRQIKEIHISLQFTFPFDTFNI